MEGKSIGYRQFESNYDVDQSKIKNWVEQFHKEGFLFLPQVLKNDHCQQLRSDLEWSLENNPNGLNSGDASSSMHLCHRMFEHSQANLNLFDLEPIVSFAEALVEAHCHVIHNNSFVTRPGKPAGNKCVTPFLLAGRSSYRDRTGAAIATRD